MTEKQFILLLTAIGCLFVTIMVIGTTYVIMDHKKQYMELGYEEAPALGSSEFRWRKIPDGRQTNKGH